MKFIAFADTNIFLDALLDRSVGNDCKEILRLAERKEIKLLTSSASIQTIIYFLQKAKIKNEAVVAIIENLLQLLSIISPDEVQIKEALHAGFTDLEDAIQYSTALKVKGIDYFITSNLKDFKKAKEHLAVLSPKQFLEQIKANQ